MQDQEEYERQHNEIVLKNAKRLKKSGLIRKPGDLFKTSKLSFFRTCTLDLLGSCTFSLL